MRKACGLFIIVLWITVSNSMIVSLEKNIVFQINKVPSLYELVEEYSQFLLQQFPEYATFAGFHEYDDKWTDFSLTAIQYRKDRLKNFDTLTVLIDTSSLSDEEHMIYLLLKYELQVWQEINKFPNEYILLTPLTGLHLDIPQLLEAMPHEMPHEYQYYIDRLSKIPGLIEQQLLLLAQGLEKGVTPPGITMGKVLKVVEQLAGSDLKNNPLLIPFNSKNEKIAQEERDTLNTKAQNILMNQVIPAFKKLYTYLETIYIPGCRSTISWADLPNGKAWYAAEIRRRTSLDLSVSAIHELGIAEVQRIRCEIEVIMYQLVFQGSYNDFLTFINADSQFLFKDRESIVAKYHNTVKHIGEKLPLLFQTIPCTACEIIAVPEYMEQSQVSAYYVSGSLIDNRSGRFYINTYNPTTRVTWEVEALSLHEAVPGHHLQIAREQELKNTPLFRRNSAGSTDLMPSYTAYIEGWALYCEGLGDKLDCYKDPYSRCGRLLFELFRAVRLVVDTGLHAFGWTREQACDYFKNNLCWLDHEIMIEVDRYIAWPAQALCYKLGELKIKELRNLAEKEIGDQFDIREFHEIVLDQGSLPLELLEQKVKKWLQQKNTENKSL